MKSRVKNFILLTAIGITPLLASAEGTPKAKCGGCCSDKGDASQSNLIGTILQSDRPILLADAGGKTLTKEAKSALSGMVAIQKALAADSMQHVSHHAAEIAAIAKEHKLQGLSHDAAAQALTVQKAKDIKAAREAFKKLSESFTTYLKKHPDKTGTFRIAYCPMAKAAWVQTGDTIANPYFGSKMLKCGSFKS